MTLCEAAAQLGGQALLAQLLPGRAEFGGIVTNLAREMELAGVKVRRARRSTRALVEAARRPTPSSSPPAASRTGRNSRAREEVHCVDAWQVLKGEANVGATVVIADWRADWIGMGLAEKLARDGCRVRLCVDGCMRAKPSPGMCATRWVGKLHKLGVEIIPYARLFGADGGHRLHAATAQRRADHRKRGGDSGSGSRPLAGHVVGGAAVAARRARAPSR